jgi:DNA-binding PadR family transcriptional regulator
MSQTSVATVVEKLVSAMTAWGDRPMTDRAQDPNGALPLPPAHLHILMALADGEKHGYAVMREVERMTDGEVSMGPGTLYGAIKRMVGAGLVEEIDERPDPDMDDERRRYYRVTGFGARVLSAETERLARLIKAARAKQAASTLRPGLDAS